MNARYSAVLTALLIAIGMMLSATYPVQYAALCGPTPVIRSVPLDVPPGAN